MHAHGRHHHASDSTARVLRWSLVATLVYIVALLITGFRANSLALISEAGHNLSDFLALGLSLVAVHLQRRPPNTRKTFGYNRAGVVAAFINASALVLIAFYLMYESAERLYRPEPVKPGLMMLMAGVGVVMNGAIAFTLFRASRDVNIRSAFLHEIGDTFSTAVVILGGLAIYYTGKSWIDPVLSIGIAVLILWSSFGIIRETLNILLEGTPRGVDVERVLAAIAEVEGVGDVHDLHVWSIGSDQHALSCHITIEDIPPSASERILREVQRRLLERFHIHHTTIQFEHAVCDIAHGCVIPVHGGAHRH